MHHPQDRKTARFLDKSFYAYCGCGVVKRLNSRKIPREVFLCILRGWRCQEAELPQDRKTARFLEKSLFASCGGGWACWRFNSRKTARPQDSYISLYLHIAGVVLRDVHNPQDRKTARFLDYSSKSSCGCGPPARPQDCNIRKEVFICIRPPYS